jgi:MYXO-CTERM domain-containing protein
VAVLGCALGASGLAHGAVALDNFRQGSHAGTASLAIGFTVGAGADRLLLVGVSTARSDVSVTGVSWRGVAGSRVIAHNVNQPGRDCRSELWRIIDPPSGPGQVAVNLTGISAMGMGMVSYSGVDQQSPTSLAVTAIGSTSPVRVPITVPSARPILGMACLGGTWGLLNGPDAVAANNDVNLWDFTEQNVVGLGNYQAQFAGNTAFISWNVAFNDPFAWGAVGLSITPAGLAPPPPPPDAAPDTGPDLRAPEDVFVPADLAPPPADAGADAALEADALEADAQESDALEEGDDAAAAPDAAVPFDGPAPDPDDAGSIIRAVDLRVGCACRLGGAPAGAPWLVVLLALGLLRRRR